MAGNVAAIITQQINIAVDYCHMATHTHTMQIDNIITTNNIIATHKLFHNGSV